MAEFNRKRLMRGGLGGVSGLTVRIILQLLQIPVLYSAWSVELASAWLVIWTLPSYMTLTVASFSSAGGNLAVAAKRAGDIQGVRAAYRATQRSIILSNILMVGAVLLLSPYMIDRHALGVDAATLNWTFALLGLFVMVRVQGATQDLIYRYGEDYGTYNMIESISSLGELAVMAVVVNSTHNLAVMPLALTAFRLCVYLGISLNARRRWPEVFEPADKELVDRNFRAALVPFFGFLAMPMLFAVNLQGYSLLVANGFGAAVFSTFLTMRTLTRMVDQVCAATGKVLFYEFSYLDFEKSKDMAVSVCGTVVLVQALIGSVYPLGLLLLGRPVHHLWTAGKVAFSPELVVIFGLAGVLRAIADPMYSILSTRNAHTRVTGIYLASSLAALALAWLLTRWHASMVEVAACVVLAELSNLLAGYYFAARMFRMPLNRFVPSLLRLGAQRLKSMPGSVKRKLQANGQAS